MKLRNFALTLVFIGLSQHLGATKERLSETLGSVNGQPGKDLHLSGDGVGGGGEIGKPDSLIADPFEGMTNGEIAKDIEDSLAKYLLSDGFVARLQKFHRIQGTIDLMHSRIGDFFQDLSIRILIPMSQDGALPDGRLVESFETGYTYYKIGDKSYLVTWPETSAKHEILSQEVSLMKEFLQKLQEAYKKGDDIHKARNEKDIENPQSFLGYIYNQYLKILQTEKYSDEKVINLLNSIISIFNELIPHTINNIIQTKTVNGQAISNLVPPLSSQDIDSLWQSRLANLTSSNNRQGKDTKKVLYEKIGAMLTGEDNTTLIEHIKIYLANQGIQEGIFDSRKSNLLENIFALRYLISKVLDRNIEEKITVQNIESFIRAHEAMSEGETKTTITKVINYFEGLGIRNSKNIAYIDSIVA